MNKNLWEFADSDGSFVAKNAHKISRLYFPLCNEQGLMSSITPSLTGDIKTGQNSYLLLPVSIEDLYNIKSGRNFWIYSKQKGVWSLSGGPADVEAGPLWHRVTKKNQRLGLSASITNFVPVTGQTLELMIVELKNISNRPVSFVPTSVIPIFGRSADNLRDHRHVTSLLHRIRLHKNGVIVKPTMTFDERGHKINYISYYVLGCDGKGSTPLGSFPTVPLFIGEGRDFQCPEAVFDNLAPKTKSEPNMQGKEAVGALRFKTANLKPKEKISYVIISGIAKDEEEIDKNFREFNSIKKANQALSENKKFWKEKIDSASFVTGDKEFSSWIRWVALQPELRRIFGNSFLPDFDYGRGGRGWRDLWQDCLALLLLNPYISRRILVDSISGVRIDGTNATIIGRKPGYFIADRNRITRVWMDHGVWPFFTISHYINQTGDFDILLEKNTYFRDPQLMRASQIDRQWEQSCKHLHTSSGRIYKATVLEHLLVENLVQFFNVGEHNHIRLEDADWNDGLDMAKERGESVAFSAFYGANLARLADIIEELSRNKGIKQISLLQELLPLIESPRRKINYGSIKQKRQILQRYLSSVKYRVSGKVVKISVDSLAQDLRKKSSWITNHIRKTEWINLDKDAGFYNGYYNNDGRRLEGKNGHGLRMTLTGQVFPIMCGVATDQQVKKICTCAKKYLKDRDLGGYRLNTDFGRQLLNIGRAFSFAYGEKENGAFFSHMNVMFANALYKRGLAREGFQVLKSIYKMASDSKISKIYPGIPEYFNSQGRGMYNYLTGSASWFLMTTISQVYGIRGEYGDLVISPKLVSEQFKKSTTTSLNTNFAGKRVLITYRNPNKLDFGAYRIRQITINGKVPTVELRSPSEILIKRQHLLGLCRNSHLKIDIILG